MKARAIGFFSRSNHCSGGKAISRAYVEEKASGFVCREWSRSVFDFSAKIGANFAVACSSYDLGSSTTANGAEGMI
jgi:hypothetical protein